MNALKETNFTFPNQSAFYRGKVRDVYTIDNQYMVMIVSDRIAAFDVATACNTLQRAGAQSDCRPGTSGYRRYCPELAAFCSRSQR